MTSPFDIFRKPHPVRVTTASRLVDGVMVPGQVLYSSAACSVQRISTNQQEQLTKGGKKISDYRRLISAIKIPLSDEVVTGTVAQPPVDSDLIADGTGEVIQFVEGKGMAGQIEIDGRWYEVKERGPMQNGIINHYVYLVYRVLANDQTV